MLARLENRNLNETAANCAKTLKKPGAVALVPTETVYGLVCDWNDAGARDKIYALKRRADSKPLAAFFPDVDSVLKVFGPMPEKAERAARAFCPGPITVVYPDGKGSTFGFRVPDHPFVLELLKKFGGPLASTSANLSGRPAALSVEDALASIDGAPDFRVDGGKIPADSKASTVVVFDDKGAWKIVRPGPISQAQLEAALKD
jgi:L-threonylcarbamoyladenylate synthase